MCCGRKSRPDFWAIKGAWLEIPEGQLFCLLVRPPVPLQSAERAGCVSYWAPRFHASPCVQGPNGAGKTTTINCLTGIVRPSGGDALVHGPSATALTSLRALPGCV